MIDKLYGKYFQKSRSFLYPALGIKRTGGYTPTGTYISIEGRIQPEDLKLICTFNKNTSDRFTTFENQMLVGNPLFHEKITTSKEYDAYVFNMEPYESDFFNIILGKYSKLSSILKKTIKEYYGDKSAEFKYIETYLYPDKFFDNYSNLLDVDVNTLRKIGELCDPIDLGKECLILSPEDLIVLK